MKYFKERRTTSHWPYPLSVNALQPRTFGNKNKNIDYSQLTRVNLDKYMLDIDNML
jgi:hypothetical protein